MKTAPVGRELFFWFDCETTGLDPRRDTVLEVSWCFTNSQLTLLTPLRQRFTSIVARATGRDGRRPVDRAGRPFRPDDEADWHDHGQISPVAREMHERSGLRIAWCDAAEASPHGILTHPRDLHRLVAEDLDMINFTNTDRLVLAGAGVSHFDDSVLAEAFDGFYPQRPIFDRGSSPLGSWHYRCFDTSIGTWVAGEVQDKIDQVLDMAAQRGNPAKQVVPFSVIECRENVDPGVLHVLDEADPEAFSRKRLTPHRAADDVVWSLLQARALRYILSQVEL